MINFANCVTKIQCRNLVTKTPTKSGIEALLKNSTTKNYQAESGLKLGGVQDLVQDTIMFQMGAKEKGGKRKAQKIAKYFKELLYKSNVLTNKFPNWGGLSAEDIAYNNIKHYRSK